MAVRIPFRYLLIASVCLAGHMTQAQPDNTAPAPRNTEGRVFLQGNGESSKGLWLPQAPLGYPVAMLAEIPFKPWARALYDARQRHELEPHARCKASGAARQFITPYGVEILELAAVQKLYIFDIGGPHTFKTVHMDGRSHPANLEHSNYGHSIGWWEGDTVVIDTIGYNEDFWFERRGLPHTTQLHTIERLTRINAGTMRYEITVDDPGAYQAPFTGGFNLYWRGGDELFEFVCQQANYAHELMVGQERDSVDRSSAIIP
jgi:hypothetical protein